MDSIVAGQVDITPLILQRLHYTGIWKGFGHDFSAPNEFHYVIGRPVQLVQIISGDFVLGYDPVQERTNYFYQYRADPELHKNLVDDPVYRTEKRKMEDYLKASIQRYNQSLIRGKLE